jgi:hypothetical protein
MHADALNNSFASVEAVLPPPLPKCSRPRPSLRTRAMPTTMTHLPLKLGGDERRTLLTLIFDLLLYPTVRCRGAYPFWDLRQCAYVRGNLVPSLGVTTQHFLMPME